MTTPKALKVVDFARGVDGSPALFFHRVQLQSLLCTYAKADKKASQACAQTGLGIAHLESRYDRLRVS